MKLKDRHTSFTVWISSDDTQKWANTPGATWLCSTLEGKSILATYDTYGLVDLAIDGHPPPDGYDLGEFRELIADLLSEYLPVGHPCRLTAVDQPNMGPSVSL